jgi:large subunit ribosomal protein L34
MSLQQAASSFFRRGGLKNVLYEKCKVISTSNSSHRKKLRCGDSACTVQPLFKIDLSLPSLWNEFTLLIKRTFQPSIIRKRRKTGFLKRQKSVGGRRVLKRRALKGRVRLGGC